MISEEIQHKLRDVAQSKGVSDLSTALLEDALRDTNLASRGLLFSILFSHWNSIELQIGSEQMIEFILDYLRDRMLAEDSSSPDEIVDWHRPYEAAWEGASLLGALWFRQSPNLERERLVYRRWLERLIVDATPEQRIIISNGLLEGLFKDGRIASFFKSWRTDPVLNAVAAGI